VIAVIAVIAVAMMSGSNSPDLSPLDYQVWGNTSLITSCNEANIIS